jgi:hypothetical protein
LNRRREALTSIHFTANGLVVKMLLHYIRWHDKNENIEDIDRHSQIGINTICIAEGLRCAAGPIRGTPRRGSDETNL